MLSIESGFDPKATNDRTGATGLWQCLPTTARWLQIQPLKNYVPEKQMDLLSMYWTRQGFTPGDFSSETDVYLSVFWPAAVGKPGSYVLQTSDISASKVAQQNNLFDADASGTITVQEISDYLKKY